MQADTKSANARQKASVRMNCSSENDTNCVNATGDYSTVANRIMDAMELVQSIAVLFGVAGNAINLVVLVRICRHLRSRQINDNSAMVMLMWMSAVDFLTLSLQLPFVVHDWKLADFCLSEANAYYECFVWYPFSQFGVTGIALLSVVISVERFAAVRDLHCVQYAFRQRASCIALLTLVIAGLFHIPRYFEKHVITVDDLPQPGLVSFTCDQTEFHNTYTAALAILTVIVNAFVPMLIVLALGAGVVHKLVVVERYHESLAAGKSKQQQRESRVSLATRLVVATMVVFSIWALLVVVTAVIMLHYGADTFFKSPLGFLIGKLCSMIALVKSSISFVLYCGTSAEYRASFRQMFTCTTKQDCKGNNDLVKAPRNEVRHGELQRLSSC